MPQKITSLEGLGDETLCLSVRAANCKSLGELATYLSQVEYSVSKEVNVSSTKLQT